MKRKSPCFLGILVLAENQELGPYYFSGYFELWGLGWGGSVDKKVKEKPVFLCKI